MSIKSEGGRAFPSNYVEQEGPNKGMQMVAGGMTRRQWLAGMALTALHTNLSFPVRIDGVEDEEKLLAPVVKVLAETAYMLADAMLAHEAKETRK